jgi:hypothetical protein
VGEATFLAHDVEPKQLSDRPGGAL